MPMRLLMHALVGNRVMMSRGFQQHEQHHRRCVAFWILPRLDAQGNRGNVALMWLCYPALNAGVLLASLPDPLRGRFAPEVLAALAVAAGILYLLATLAFVLHAWRRVLPFRTISRRERS